MWLDSEVIFVFSAAALGYPKYDRGEHQPDVLGDVAVAVVLVHLGVVVQDVLEDQDADASSETASHQSEADKQKESSPPDRPRIAEPVLSANPVLVDQADDEHSEERADPWDPVDERDVHQYRFRLVGRSSVRGEDRGVEESPIGDGEQCTGEVNTDCTFVLSEPRRKVRAWVHTHPAWVVIGSW